jgi:capsular exopolysaccharide synthesis family protein
MTRLKDALEKAARDGSDESRLQHFSHPPQVVPDAWQFDDNEAIVVGAADQPTIPELAAFADAGAQPEAVTVSTSDSPVEEAAESPVDAAADVWAAYQFGKKAMGKIVVGPTANHGLIEQYRRLGAALHHHQLQTGARTMMVTSAVASEGKTLTATNLALTLSHSYQRRVLLIDADLRRPSVHDLLHLPNAVGLGDSLKQPERGPKFHTLSPRFSALTAGRPDSDPMAGLVSETMNQILRSASQEFDWVIVDTPPVAMLPDANLLAAMIDTALLVVGANTTPYPMVRRAVEAIGEQRILGVVLNRMSAAEIVAAYNYYGYGAYAYGLVKESQSRFKFWKNRKKRSKTKPGAEVAAG